MIELKLETNLKQLTLTNVCADDLRTRLRTIRGTANEQSNKTMNVGKITATECFLWAKQLTAPCVPRSPAIVLCSVLTLG